MNARLGWLNWCFDNPPLFGELGGKGIERRGLYGGQGSGDTLSLTLSGIYTLTPSLLIDGYVGHTRIANQVESVRLDEQLGSSYLGIPGTNRPDRASGGWPAFRIDGFDTYGRANENAPWYHRNRQSQYAVTLAWLRGGHNIRAGYESLNSSIRMEEPAGHPGSFGFSPGTTGSPGRPHNEHNSYAAFLLGLASDIQKRSLWVTPTSVSWAHSLFVRDKWPVSRRLSLSLGVRWDYFPPPVRSETRGFEI